MPKSKHQPGRWLFRVAVIFKAIDGVLEVAGGFFLVFKPGFIGPEVANWAADLLIDHPASRIAHSVAHWGGELTGDTEHFASIYLIAHGAAKVFITWGLLREKLWAFPTALVVFGLLILYQLYRFTHTHSLTLAFLIMLDVGVCFIIWREYRFRRRRVEATGIGGR